MLLFFYPGWSLLSLWANSWHTLLSWLIHRYLFSLFVWWFWERRLILKLFVLFNSTQLWRCSWSNYSWMSLSSLIFLVYILMHLCLLCLSSLLWEICSSSSFKLHFTFPLFIFTLFNSCLPLLLFFHLTVMGEQLPLHMIIWKMATVLDLLFHELMFQLNWRSYILEGIFIVQGRLVDSDRRVLNWRFCLCHCHFSILRRRLKILTQLPWPFLLLLLLEVLELKRKLMLLYPFLAVSFVQLWFWQGHIWTLEFLEFSSISALFRKSSWLWDWGGSSTPAIKRLHQ